MTARATQSNPTLKNRQTNKRKHLYKRAGRKHEVGRVGLIRTQEELWKGKEYNQGVLYKLFNKKKIQMHRLERWLSG